jgi:hypothetical protein
MKTATIVINRDTTFAPTQLVIKDQYGLDVALSLIKDKRFGNYSRSRFFWEIPIRNADGEELVVFIQVKKTTRWDDVKQTAQAISELSTTWMLGESPGVAMLGGYVVTALSDEWCDPSGFSEVRNFPGPQPVARIDEETTAPIGTIYVRPKYSAPLGTYEPISKFPSVPTSADGEQDG